TATQTINLSDYLRDIDSGAVSAHLEAQMGGYSVQGDFGQVVATFLDAAENPIKSFRLGPASGTDYYAANLDYYEADAPLPPGARFVQVRLIAQRQDGVYNDAHFDNLWLSLERTGAPAVRVGDV